MPNQTPSNTALKQPGALSGFKQPILRLKFKINDFYSDKKAESRQRIKKRQLVKEKEELHPGESKLSWEPVPLRRGNLSGPPEEPCTGSGLALRPIRKRRGKGLVGEGGQDQRARQPSQQSHR